MEQLPQNVLDIIASAVAQATRQTVEVLQQQAPERNYFKITEKLLYSYPTLKRIVSDKAAYTRAKRRCSLQPEQSVEKSGRYFRGYGEGQRSGIRYNRKGIQAAGSCNTGVQRPERICRYPFVLLQGAGGRNAATRGRAGNDVGRSKLPDRQRVKNRNSLAK